MRNAFSGCLLVCTHDSYSTVGWMVATDIIAEYNEIRSLSPFEYTTLAGYDGGDCCSCTCDPDTYYGYGCGEYGYACIDPEAACVDDDDGVTQSMMHSNRIVNLVPMCHPRVAMLFLWRTIRAVFYVEKCMAPAAPLPVATPVPTTPAPLPTGGSAPASASPAPESAQEPTTAPNTSSEGRLSGLAPLLETCRNVPPFQSSVG